jgi:myo-inositol catabolism protein IolS
MKTRLLGSTGVSVGVIGMGGAALSGEGGGYGFGQISDKDSEVLLRACFDAGVNVIDLAPVYGFGLAEERVGRVFGDSSGFRDRVFIVSKSGITWDQRKRVIQDNRPKTAVCMLEQSLRRLKTDVIDLYMIHWPEGGHGRTHTFDGRPVDLAETLSALDRERKAGKIRFLGLSNFSPEQAKPLLSVAKTLVLQNEWNAWHTLRPQSSSQEFLAFCRECKLGLIGWGTLDKGILSGRVVPERKFDPCDARSWAPWWINEDRRWKFETLNKLSSRLAGTGLSLLDFALDSALKTPELSCALVGIRSIAQLKEIVRFVTG